jgi:EpsI family protein
MLTRTITLFICFTVAATLIGRAGQSEPRPMRTPFAAFPMALGEWHGRQEPAFDDKTLAVLGVDDYLTRAYFSPGFVAGLYIGYWASQRQGDTIHSPLNCLPGAGWAPLSKGTLQIQVLDSASATSTREISVNRYLVQKGLDRELVLYWYQSHGRVVASEYVSKMSLVSDAVRLHRTDATLVRVMIPILGEGTNDAQAEQAGMRFVKSLFPVLVQYLPS